MPLVIYHNPRCSKSRQTLEILKAKGAPHRVVEYLTSPPDASELKRILSLLGMQAADIVRRKEAAEAGLDIGSLAEEALIAAMVANPIVIERPIVVGKDKAVVGRPPENVLDLI